ncbi:helix-hairpin-helix domain-containing protein [Pedobacter alpinus]|uniref:Helix-hairpin-helix domain-containing protein n=1 Tax=Pedobacter alpinus TaxID=1590643 RepID=A0ABW5TSM4_9SPHI
MNQKLKDYLEVSPREFRGIVVFVLIMLFVFVSPYVYERIMFQPLKISIETLTPKIDSVEAFNEKTDRFYPKEENKKSTAQLFDFNPNHLPTSEWMKLGLSKKQALMIKKYEDKGGQFRNINDVKKMWAIKPELFEQLLPHIKIPEQTSATNFNDTKTPNKTISTAKSIATVEINSADSASLLAIRGIGPAFASRIIKYRNRLGGFLSINQLKEVWGIDSLKFEQIKTQVLINTNAIQKIDINKCTFEELKTFPYLSYKQSNTILAYRKQHGDFKNATDLNKIAILTPEIIQKITPYFKF